MMTSSEQHVIPINNVHDVLLARRTGMDAATGMGFVVADATKIGVTISELARNIFVYAKTGTVTINCHCDCEPPCLEIIASDSGPGIEDVKLAMTDGWASSGGLGLGLSGSERLMDEFSIESRVGVGTTIIAVKCLT